MISQTLAVVALNLKNLPRRLASSAVAVVGIAGVVAIVVGVLSIAEGFAGTMTRGGSPETVMVLRAGTDTEMNSGLTREEARLIADAPGIRRGTGGSLASPELMVVVDLPRKSTGTAANVPLRGVAPAAFEIRDGIEIVAGRAFTPGRQELIAGVGAADAFAGLEVGSEVELGQSRWRVVGIFAAGGGIAESEVWTDAEVLMPAYRRGGFQSVWARLDSPAAFDTFKDALTTDPRLEVEAMRERDYYAEQSRALETLITVLGTVIALIVGLAAVFAAFNTFYAAVAARTREIATLRALGFSRLPVVVSVLAEAVVLGLLGGALGGALAWLAFDGFRTATLNWQSFSQVAFAFAVTPSLLGKGIAYALAIALVGALLPAWRAARLPVATALREL